MDYLLYVILTIDIGYLTISFFLCDHVAWHVGSSFPDWGWNPHRLLSMHTVLTTGPPVKSPYSCITERLRPVTNLSPFPSPQSWQPPFHSVSM